MRSVVATMLVSPAQPPSDLIKSAARALDVLELFARRRQPLSAGELGLALGYPRSSLNVLLKSLVTQGYLAHDLAAATYFPTLRVTMLGDWLPNTRLIALAEPAIAQLRDATRETVTLTALSGTTMRVMKALIGPEPIALQLSEGMELPVIGSAIGAAALALLPPEQADRVVNRAARGELAANARRAVEDGRLNGFAIAYNAVVSDTGAIARGLRTGRSEVFVLAVAGLASRIRRDENRLASLLTAAAAALEAEWSQE